MLLPLLVVCLAALAAADVSTSTSSSSPPSSPSPVSDHRFFLQEIFQKYGHDGQMTFEGFEHLLESLGLGNIIIQDHDVAAHREKEFRDTHLSHDHHDPSSAPPPSSSTTQKTVASSTPPSLNHYSLNAIPTPSVGGAPIVGEGGEVYRFRLRDANIPELLVNISTLVDQHQELVDRTPEIVIEQCLSPKEILETFGINQTSSLNPVSFLHLCPAIIYELDQGHCMLGGRGGVHSPTPNPQPTLYQWAYSCVAVLAISLCGLLSVAVIPLMQRRFYHTLLQFFVGLAVGTLSGDALLHLLPHAMLGGHGGDDHSSSEKGAVWHGLAALGGVFFFFLAERLLGALANRKRRNPPDTPPEEKLSQYAQNSLELEMSEKEIIKMLGGDGVPPSRKPSADFSVVDALPKKESSVVSVEPHQHHGHGHSHNHEVPQSVSAVAWMVIMGDGLHNFCDGLAIGAAFATGVEGGISTSVAVFCHELPHELGDFAMLLKTGMKAREALLYNALSSLLCFAGMVAGVCLGNIASGWVFAATAGIFLYIALVDMLPELSVQSGDPEVSSAHQLAIQVLGVCFGVSVMFLIANYEQDLQNIVSS